MTIVFVDIESYSTIDLKACGVYRYSRCPDMLLLMAGWSIDGGPVDMTIGHAATLERFLEHRASGAEFVAHNANFERVMFSAAMRATGHLGLDEYLPPEEWEDTRALAAEQGYPQSLDKLAKALGTAPKDEAGTALINLFCKPNRKGERNRPEDHPLKWLDFIAYCEQDVETLIQVYDRLMADGGWPTKTEREVFLVDQRINDRGIGIDVRLAEAAREAAIVNQAAQQERIYHLVRVKNARSVPQMMEWITAENIRPIVPNLRAETIEAALRHPKLGPTQREVLGLRLEIALAAPAKFATAVDSHVNERLHGTLQFFGAHTGRWSGKGTQPQNLPRAAFKHEVDAELAIEDVLAGVSVTTEELKMLVRPMFLGPFVVVDYTAIEACVIAWLAGEEWALEAFRAGRDIYTETAARMGGLTRAQGKVCVLALGYNGGATSLRSMATERDFIDVDGEAVSILTAPDDLLYSELVYPWREANQRIVRLWKMLDNRFRSGGPVGEHLSIERRGKDRLLRLPSGRYIAYRNVALRVDKNGKERLTFDTPHGYRTDTYGGRLAENATQAVARDILAEALIRLDRAGRPVVAHVHDEVLVQGHYDLADIEALMFEPPAWADGLPISGSGFATRRYRK